MKITEEKQVRFTERARKRAAVCCAFSIFEEMRAGGLISDAELDKIKKRYIDQGEDVPCQEE